MVGSNGGGGGGGDGEYVAQLRQSPSRSSSAPTTKRVRVAQTHAACADRAGPCSAPPCSRPALHRPMWPVESPFSCDYVVLHKEQGRGHGLAWNSNQTAPDSMIFFLISYLISLYSFISCLFFLQFI